MKQRQPIPADDDPLLRRARRVLAEVARLVGPSVAGSQGGGGGFPPDLSRSRIVSLATDLELLIRVLTKSRDALGLEMSARTRGITAISAYGRAVAIGRQYARETRRRTCTE